MAGAHGCSSPRCNRVIRPHIGVHLDRTWLSGHFKQRRPFPLDARLHSNTARRSADGN